ncbi:acyl-CoA dehydrogenase family protein [Caballeronia mineralivorans]|jgi:alkylation response protein AidB-like acyl-CoA dehydrogenase|uniref:acyl-CoA dehydrogenase family protein n=1 Tax=Caballeronia mineralivorans TaxID=2010198 RepID=UPI0023F02BA5|nr:acyl-CoA dehydrogenase family protein [Caballeronia mineralivorans]MDB5785802.1 acyl-CoA dehydrogenase [Caballeronia mineralivorans]
MVPRTLFGPEHEDFRKSMRRFYADEIMPHHATWEERGHVDREIWNRAGELGFLCLTVPEEYGGMGVDTLYSVILMEEQAYAGATGMSFSTHNDIVASYIFNFGTEDQKKHWLPRMARGDAVGALAMTEPGTGSDLQAITTHAVKDGDDYVINGQKIFITNGYLSDIVLLVAKTGKGGAKNISLILVETNRPGFSRGKPLKKVGLRAQDTCELFFDDVRVPQTNLLGGVEGKAFPMLMKELAFERLTVAVTSIAAATAALETTLEYTRNRKVFGNPVASYQNSRFKLAEMKAQIGIGQVYVDRCLELHLEKKLSGDAAAAAKYWSSELLCNVVDECVQLHGGYGFMLEYRIARAYIDSRASRIYVGTNEIMKEVIARAM